LIHINSDSPLGCEKALTRQHMTPCSVSKFGRFVSSPTFVSL
jgi:hypothetical protein